MYWLYWLFVCDSIYWLHAVYEVLYSESLETAKMTFKVIKVIGNDAFRQMAYSFLTVLRCNPVSVSYCFRDISTGTTYLARNDFQKYFRSNVAMEIVAQAIVVISVLAMGAVFFEILALERCQVAEMAFRVTRSRLN